VFGIKYQTEQFMRQGTRYKVLSCEVEWKEVSCGGEEVAVLLCDDVNYEEDIKEFMVL
jgi:hypothetical protein